MIVLKFKDEKELTEYIESITPFACKSKNKLKYPFISRNAQNQVIKCIVEYLIKKSEK